jgi:type IV pilus assembly protein PilN
MIRINLQGQPRPKKGRRGGPPLEGSVQIIFLLVAAGLGLGFLVVHYGLLQKELNGELERVQKFRSNIAQLQKTQGEVEQFKRQRELLKQRISVIEALQRNRTGAQELLDAVANTVNRVNALWMTSITQKGNSLDIQGTADSMSAVADFITQLKRSGYFDKVEIKETKQDERHPNATTFIFTLTADFVLPGQSTATPGAAAKTGKS